MMNGDVIKKVFFIFLTGLVIFHHFFGYLGHFGWDDMEYARLAKLWADNGFDLTTNHFTYRWTIIGFTGIMYKLFGMSDLTSAVPSMLITILSAGIIFWITRKTSALVTITALSLFVFNQWTLFYSDKIMTDCYVAFAVLGAIATIWNYKFEAKGKYALLHSLFFTGFLFFGFLSKETIFLIVPALLFVFFSDILQKQNIKFWIFSIITGSLFLALYFVLLKIKTGNPWIRFDAISLNSYMSPCRYDLLPFGNLFSRISYELLGEMLMQTMITGIIFIIPALFFIRNKELLKIPCPESFFVSVSLLAVLCANFMTTSFTSYVPMCVDVRHYLFISPLLAIAAAPYIVKYFQFREGRISIPVIAAVFLVIAIVSGYFNSLYVYVPLIVLLGIRSFLPSVLGQKIRNLFFILFFASLLIQPMVNMFSNRAMKFREIEPFVKKHFYKNEEKNIIITDIVLKRISDYYMEFDTAGTRFISFNDASETNLRNYNHIFIFQNDYTWWISETRTEHLPLFMNNFRDTLFKMVDSCFNMKLYEVPRPEYLLVFGKKTEILNNFEYDTLAGWNINPLNLTKDKYFTGLRSDCVGGQGYSSTLVKPLSGLISDSTLWIDVSVTSEVYLTENAEGQMVMSLEMPDGKVLTWLGKSLRSEIHNNNKWSNISYHNRIAIPADSLKKDAFFKIYIWNDHSSTLYIDDLKAGFRCINHL